MPITKFILQLLKNQKIIDPCERSAFQLIEQFVMGENTPKVNRSTAKADANLFKKLFTDVFRRLSTLY